MKIIVFSDSHGASASVDKLACHYKTDMIFCGDGIHDVEEAEKFNPSVTIYRVYGNCDLGFNMPRFIVIPFGRHRLFCTHGHAFGNGDKDLIIAEAVKNKCDCALFGHTHCAVSEERNGILLVNPGSLGYKGSYAILSDTDGILTAEIKDIDDIPQII